MIVYKERGASNTQQTLEIVFAKAAELGIPIVVASTSGATAIMAAAMAQKAAVKLVIVGHAYGSREKGKNAMLPENIALLREMNIPVVAAAHALSGAERGLSSKLGGAYPVEIMAHTLRMLSPGVKVGVEIGAMAMDAGLVLPEPIVTVGGSSRGADTAMLLTPSYSSAILETKVHEILCMPY